MCYAVDCRVCGKVTWDGCGRHVDDVMGSVPAARQCRCTRPTKPPRGFAAMLRRRSNG
jgi:hypothetical protein